MAGLLGHKPDDVGDYWSKKESTCDHTQAFQVFNNEKFNYCPDCGEKIDWKKLEDKVGKNNGKSR